MASKAKSCYLSVVDSSTNKNVLQKVFFKMADLHAYTKTEEFVKTYPKEKYTIFKEVY